MSDDLQQLESWLTPLINKLSPKERRVLAREVARDLRIANRERIKAQTNPDGTPYEPRSEIRGRSGRIRRKAMFTKLRTAKYLRIKTTADTARWVSWAALTASPVCTTTVCATASRKAAHNTNTPAASWWVSHRPTVNASPTAC